MNSEEEHGKETEMSASQSSYADAKSQFKDSSYKVKSSTVNSGSISMANPLEGSDALSSARAQCLAIPHFGCLHADLMDAAHAGQHHGGAWQLQSLRPLLA